MTPAQLIEVLQTLSQDKSILCQVVGSKSGAWNMEFEFVDIPKYMFVQLRVHHRQIEDLPMTTGESIRFKE